MHHLLQSSSCAAAVALLLPLVIVLLLLLPLLLLLIHSSSVTSLLPAVCVCCVCTCSVTAACLLTVVRCQNWCTHSYLSLNCYSHLHRLLLPHRSEPHLFCICACVQNCAGLVVCARHQPHPVYSATLLLLLHYYCYLCAPCTPRPFPCYYYTAAAAATATIHIAYSKPHCCKDRTAAQFSANMAKGL
jgi:hypothetical protein